VADFSRVLAGPLATMVLGDLGAEVVKVERPEGDDTRAWGPPWNAAGGSLVLDLRLEEDRELARELARRADVVIENFRPGTMERLGLGEAGLREGNPGLVWCSVTGFGQDSDLPGYDLLIQAVGGLMSVTGESGRAPMKVGVALVDVIAGLFAAVGILAALRERDAAGRGQRVDVSLFASLLTALVNQASGYLGAGVVPRRMGNRHPSVAPYEAFAAADGEIVVAVGNDRQFDALCRALGEPALACDERFATNPARVAHLDELGAALAPRFASRTRAELADALGAAGVPCGPVNDVGAAFALAQELGLDRIVELAEGVRQVASPIELDATPVRYRLPPPALGADGPALRAWLRAPDGAPPP